MKQHFITAINSLLIFLWTYTALSKLTAFNTSVTFLKKSPLLPVAEPLAVMLPVAELFLAIMLVVPRSRRIALKASLLLLLVFTGYIIYMLNWYPQRPCNCGGVINTMSWKQHIFFNLFLIALNIFAITAKPQPTTYEPSQP